MLTAYDKYSLGNSENLWEPIQMQLSKNLKTFSNILLILCNLHQILDILEKMMTLVAYVFSKIHAVKRTLTQMFK